MSGIRDRLKNLLAQLNEGLVDRDEAMKLALLSLLAGENILLVGPPGTAKSLISRQVAKALKEDGKEGASHFEYLLTKFSTPEEIFGPLSISKLKEDRFERNTAGYLPSVRVAFLDEIFKASSSILNALLTILNERIYHNGAVVQTVPLRSLIAASNELPTGQEELGALYDRFLLRSFVDYVSQDNLHQLFTLGKSRQPERLTQLTADELGELDKLVATIAIPDAIQEAVLDIWDKHRALFKGDRREGLSDRRLVKVINLLKVSALTNDRAEVNLSDVMLLRYCLWDHPDNIDKVGGLIRDTLRNYSSLVLDNGQNRSETLENRQSNSRETKSAKNKASIIPGLRGDGTERDPILIENLGHLQRLEQPEVGLQGYYFRQTTDIDGSTLSSWFTIAFQGHYDGNGFTIQGRKRREALFNTIQSGSITRLRLSGCSLADQVMDFTIGQCTTDQSLVLKYADKCQIKECGVVGSLVEGEAKSCTVSRCQVSGISIGNDYPKLATNVEGCTISDCLFLMDDCNYLNAVSAGGVTHSFHNSKIMQCYIAGVFKGTLSSFDYFGCFSRVIGYSEIKFCALGIVSISSNKTLHGFFYENKGGVILSNNASTDAMKLTDRINDANGRDGKMVAAALFNRDYFEHILGWDFDTVWAWDNQSNSPVLQSVGLRAGTMAREPIAGPGHIDLLTQQMNANLWL